MSVDTRIRLPEDVRISDVAEAMGILAGLKPEARPLSDGYWSVWVPGATARGHENIPQMATITLSGEMVDGQKEHQAYYHYEMDAGEPAGRLVSVRCTPFWIAIGKALVDFFGGTVDYADCDDVKVNYRRKKPRKANNEADGKPWQDFQEAMFALKPITKADINKCRQWAAYK